MKIKFSELEKENIQSRLLESCRRNWTKYGYRNTKVQQLCDDAGISKGGFYAFYPSKEDIFVDVLINIQRDIENIMTNALKANYTKYDLGTTLKLVYIKYAENNFIMETNTPDFISLINKVSSDRLEEITYRGKNDIKFHIQNSNLSYKIDEEKALAILGVLFSTALTRENIPYDHIEIFNFMLDNLIEDLFI